MCENADKTIHLKTLIAEIKVLFAQWRKARKNRSRSKLIQKFQPGFHECRRFGVTRARKA